MSNPSMEGGGAIDAAGTDDWSEQEEEQAMNAVRYALACKRRRLLKQRQEYCSTQQQLRDTQAELQQTKQALEVAQHKLSTFRQGTEIHTELGQVQAVEEIKEVHQALQKTKQALSEAQRELDDLRQRPTTPSHSAEIPSEEQLRHAQQELQKTKQALSEAQRELDTLRPSPATPSHAREARSHQPPEVQSFGQSGLVGQHGTELTELAHLRETVNQLQHSQEQDNMVKSNQLAQTQSSLAATTAALQAEEKETERLLRELKDRSSRVITAEQRVILAEQNLVVFQEQAKSQQCMLSMQNRALRQEVVQLRGKLEEHTDLVNKVPKLLETSRRLVYKKLKVDQRVQELEQQLQAAMCDCGQQVRTEVLECHHLVCQGCARQLAKCPVCEHHVVDNQGVKRVVVRQSYAQQTGT